MPNLSNEYSIKYKGKFDSLDALTVLQSQIQFLNIINEIVVTEHPEISFQLRIKGFKKGSLDVQQILDMSIASGMFAMENFEYVKSIFKVFSDVIKIKGFL